MSRIGAVRCGASVELSAFFSNDRVCGEFWWCVASPSLSRNGLTEATAHVRQNDVPHNRCLVRVEVTWTTPCVLMNTFL